MLRSQYSSTHLQLLSLSPLPGLNLLQHGFWETAQNLLEDSLHSCHYGNVQRREQEVQYQQQLAAGADPTQVRAGDVAGADARAHCCHSSSLWQYRARYSIATNFVGSRLE